MEAALASSLRGATETLNLAGDIRMAGRAHDFGARFGNRGLHLLVLVVVGAAVYTGSMFLFARRFVAQQIRDFKRILPGSSSLTSSESRASAATASGQRRARSTSFISWSIRNSFT